MIKEKAKHPYNTQVNITLDYFMEQIDKRTKHQQDFTYLLDVILSDSQLKKGTGHTLPLHNDASKPVEDFLKQFYDEIKKGQELNKLDDALNKIFGETEQTNFKYGIIYYYETIQETTEDKINIIINKLKNNEDITPKKCIIDLETNKQEFTEKEKLSFYDLELIGIGSSEKTYYKDLIEPKLKKYFTPSGIKNIKSYYNKIPKIKKGGTNQQAITFYYVFNNRELIYNHDEIKTFNDLLDFKINQYKEENIKLQEELKEYNINIDNKTYNVLNDIAIQFYNRNIEELIPINRLLQAYEPITEEQKQLKDFINNKYNYNEIQAIIKENNKNIDELSQELQNPLIYAINDDFIQLIDIQYFNRNLKNYIEKVEEQNQLQQVKDNSLIENIIFGNVYLEEIKDNEFIKDYELRKEQNKLNNNYLQEDKKKLEQLKKQSRFNNVRQTSFFGDDEPLHDEEIEQLTNSINNLQSTINKDEKILKQTIVIYKEDNIKQPKYYKPVYNNNAIKSVEDLKDTIKIVMIASVSNDPYINVIKHIPKSIKTKNDKYIYANEYLTSKLLTKLSAFTSALYRKASNGNDTIIFDIKELEHITNIMYAGNNKLRDEINLICSILKKTDLEEMQLKVNVIDKKTNQKSVEKLEDPKATIIYDSYFLKKQLYVKIPSYLKQAINKNTSFYEQSKELQLDEPEKELLHRYIASLMNNDNIKENGEIKTKKLELLKAIQKTLPKYYIISDRAKREISLIIEPIIELLEYINNYTNYGIINWNKVKKEIENITNYDAFSKYMIELFIKNPHPKTDLKRLKMANSYNEKQKKLNDALKKATK